MQNLGPVPNWGDLQTSMYFMMCMCNLRLRGLSATGGLALDIRCIFLARGKGRRIASGFATMGCFLDIKQGCV